MQWLVASPPQLGGSGACRDALLEQVALKTQRRATHGRCYWSNGFQANEMLAFYVCDCAHPDVLDGAEFISAMCHYTTNVLCASHSPCWPVGSSCRCITDGGWPQRGYKPVAAPQESSFFHHPAVAQAFRLIAVVCKQSTRPCTSPPTASTSENCQNPKCEENRIVIGKM